MENKFTGERLTTEIYGDNTINHLHRYVIPKKYIKDKVVLDIASGDGYGSNLMTVDASFVYGVDIDERSVEAAKRKYKKENLKYLVGSTSAIPLDDNSVDVVISFETLEHHDEHLKMIEEIKRVLKINGLCFISSPDKHFYSDIRNFNNKFHVKELYKKDFIELVSNHFANVQILSQSFLNGNSIILEDTVRAGFGFFTGDYSELSATESHPQFLIAICSDAEFEKLNNSIFDGNVILKTSLRDFKAKIYNSKSYIFGQTILAPFRYIRKIFKKAK